MSISSSVQSPSRPSSRSDLGEDQEGEDSGTLVTPPPPSPKKSQIDTIYSENRVRIVVVVVIIIISLLIFHI